MITNRNTKRARTSSQRVSPLVILGGGVLLVIIILVSFFPMTWKVKDDEYIKELEQRIVFLEQQLAELSPALLRSKQNENIGSQVDRLNTTWQKLDASLTLKTKLLAERLEKLEARVVVYENEIKQRPAPSSIPRKEIKKNVSAPKTSPRYHVVEKGDTAYNISKHYGLSLQKLKDLNKFNEKTTIYPGQKILVEP